MNIRILLFTISLLLSISELYAQKLHISLHLPNQKNRDVTLAYYYLDNIYASDTTHLDEKGIGVFEKDSLVPQGLYKILIDKDNHYDFIMGADQEFSIYNETTSAKDMKTEGSAESKAFIDYINFLDGIKLKGQQYSEEMKTANADEKKKIQEKLDQLNADIEAYRDNIGKKLPESFLYRFLMANEVPKLDTKTLPMEIQENDSLLLMARFEYQKQHYWDNFDYTDERFMYTPLFKPKLETWFNKVLYPAYDSVKPYVYEFLGKVEDNPRIFQFATSFFLNEAINSNYLGMDALFVDLAKDYYLSGKAFWASEATLKTIRENVTFMKDNLIGKTAPDLLLESLDGEYVDLHQIDAEITVVLIFEPNCGHCKKFVPAFHDEVYEKFKDKGLKVFAIYSMDNRQEWEDFLYEHNLYDWINVWDAQDESRFKILYDGRITPGVYVLDRDKKIIAKKLDVEQIKDLIGDKLN